jgi:cbb3-type cytochrome oxidase subunit 1
MGSGVRILCEWGVLRNRSRTAAPPTVRGSGRRGPGTRLHRRPVRSGTCDTEDRGVTSDITSESAGTHPAGGFVPGADQAARSSILVATVFLVVGSLLALAAAVQIVEPDFLGGVAALSYGRLQPVATGAVLYGWLTIGLVGAAFYVTPRLAGTRLRDERTAAGALGLLVVGYGAGLVAVLAGANQGREYVEAPLWAAAIVFVGLVAAAAVVTRTVRSSPREDLGPAQWYLTAAPWWLVLVHVAGNVPGMIGVNSSIQSAFYAGSITGLWFAAAGLGVVYYLIPAVTGRPPFPPTRLGVAAFWSLAFTWAWTGPRALVYGPGPDWLETIGVLFSIGLLIPLVLLGADLALAMRGHWDRVAGSVPLRFVVAGAGLFALVPVYNLLLALRSSVAVVGFTRWVQGYEVLVYFGAVTLWLFALAYHALAESGSVPGRDRVAAWHLRLTLTGVGVAVTAALVAGLQVGFTWAAGGNNGDIAVVGDGFANAVRPLRGLAVALAVGFGIYALGQVLGMVRMVRILRPTTAPAAVDGDAAAMDDDLETAGPLRLRPLLQGSIALAVVAAVSVWLVPSLEADHTEGTLLGDTARRYAAGSAEAEGREVYVREGCWYCHTQAVRAIVTDVDLGPVSLPGDYAHEVPALLGVQRLGPDLMHAGSRQPTDSADWVRSHLVSPRSVRSWSTMPAYDHLSDADLDALTAYIVGLR